MYETRPEIVKIKKSLCCDDLIEKGASETPLYTVCCEHQRTLSVSCCQLDNFLM